MITQSARANPLPDLVNKFQLPALSTAVYDNGKLQIEAAGTRKYGDSTLVTNQDKWHWGSNGKSMTAFLSALVVQDGKIKWESTLQELYPELVLHGDFKSTTLRQLLAHRSGLPALTSAKEDSDKAIDPNLGVDEKRSAYAMLMLQNPAPFARDDFNYSNTGYIILGDILRRTTGKSWEQLIQEKLFEKLGMNSCGLGAAGSETPSEQPPTQPWPHLFFENKLVPIPPTEKYSDNDPVLSPAGRIHCSMTDWMKFAEMQIKAYHQDQDSLLSKESTDVLQKDLFSQQYTSGALISNLDSTLLGHNGSNTMNFAIYIMDLPSRKAFAAVSNRGDELAMKAVQEAMKLIGSPNICIPGFCLLGN